MSGLRMTIKSDAKLSWLERANASRFIDDNVFAFIAEARCNPPLRFATPEETIGN